MAVWRMRNLCLDRRQELPEEYVIDIGNDITWSEL